MVTKKDLIQAIKSSLDCHTHFHKPTIQSNDSDFMLGKRAMVVCQQCVERFEELIDKSGVVHYPFKNVRAIVKEGKHA